MRLFMGAILALLLLALPIFAEDTPNKVPGLEITAGATVQPDEGFLVIEAKCVGPVSWIVLGTSPNLKYRVSEAEKNIIVAVPPPGHTVTVMAVGIADGKLTEFARSDYSVSPGAQPTDPKNPVTPIGKLPVGTKLFVAVIADQSVVGDSKLIPREMAKQGHTYKVYKTTDPTYTANIALVKAVAEAGGAPAVVIAKYNADGKASIITKAKLPVTEADFIILIDGLFAR